MYIYIHKNGGKLGNRIVGYNCGVYPNGDLLTIIWDIMTLKVDKI